MTTVHAEPSDRTPASPSRAVAQQSRIVFRQPVSTAGFIDAAWWPRTRDLTVELPPLMDVLWTAGREINRITYYREAWDAAPRRMQIEGRTVRLGAFTVGDPHTITLSDPWAHERIDILVVTPDNDPARAQRIFDLVADGDNLCRSGDFLDRVDDAHGPRSAR